MARAKTGGRKQAIINPLNEDLAKAGDGHGLMRATFVAGEPRSLDPPMGPGAGTNAISLTGGAYTQNFNTLAQTGTSSLTPTDWFFAEAGTNANATYSAGTGTSTGGDTYSYGVAGVNAVSDRAFGGLQSGTLVPTIGASFTNNSGGPISSILISYVGEQWRFGSTVGPHTVADRLDFQISFDAASLATGTWADVNALDFSGPINSGAARALDGNAAANRTAISSTITNLAIANGATFWIRWTDFNASDSDDGLAIDDFSMSTPGSLAINDVTMAEGTNVTTDFIFTVTRTGGSSGAVGATWTLTLSGSADSVDFSLYPLTGTVSFANGETSKQIIVGVRGDTAFEPNETFTVLLSAPTGGVAIGDGTGLGTITNDDPPPNQNPAIAGLDNDAVGWTEDSSGPAILDADALLTVTDADSADFNGGTLTVSVSTNAVAGEDVLSLASQPGSIELSDGNVLHNGIAIGTWTGGTNGAALVFTFNAAATPLGVTALMRNLTYDNSSQDPMISQREIQYVLTDGDGGSTSVHSLVSINSTDDAPEIGGLTGDSVNWSSGDDPVLIDVGGNATVTDVDSSSFPDVLLQVSSSHGAEDAIGIADVGGVTHDGTDVFVDGIDIGDIVLDGTAGFLQVQLSGLATPDYVQRLLHAITFANVAGTPTVGPHVMSVELFDPSSSVGGYAQTIVNVAAGRLGVGNLVFLDVNNNGLFDAGDSGIDGVTVELLSHSHVLATTITSGGGLYSFGGLAAGEYLLRLVRATLPAGLDSIAGASFPNANIDNVDDGVGAGAYVLAADTVILTAGGEPIDDGDGADSNLTVDFGFVYTPPFIDLDLSSGGIGYAASFAEGAPGTAIVNSNVTIASVRPITGITITLTDHVAGDILFVDAIAFQGEDLQSTLYDSSSGTITIFGTGTIAEWQQALTVLRYRNTTDDPTLGDTDIQRSISVVVSSGAGASNPATATVDIIAVNTPASIGGTAVGDILEDTTPATGAQLTISDPDGPDTFVAFGPVAGSGGYGSFSLSESGAWTYEANNALIQFLGAGVTAVDTIEAVAADGTVRALTVTLTGVNDAAAIDGDDTGAVTEDGGATVGGTLTVDDVDAGESAFVAMTDHATAHGTFSIDAGGLWSYTLDDARDDHLPAGVQATDTITISSADGTTRDIAITITGVNDAPAFGGESTVSVTEDGTTFNSATLTIGDADDGESSFQEQMPVATAYGTFSIDANGNWSYQLDNSNPDVQALNDGQTLTETIPVHSFDGTETNVVVTINGADEPLAIPPGVDLDGAAAGINSSVGYSEGQPGTRIGTNIAVTQGTLPITRATITITDSLAGDTLALAAGLRGGIAVDAVNSTPTNLILIGIGTPADWAAALALVRYTNTGDNPDDFGTDLQRTISVVLSDGVAPGAAAIATVTIVASNDAPTVGALDGDSVVWTEGDSYVLLDQNMPATVFDPDNQNFGGGFLSVGVQANPRAEDEFFVLDIFPGVGTIGDDVYVDGVHIGTISDSGPGRILLILFNGNATAERVASLLDHVAYRNVAGDDPSAGARSVTYLLNDGRSGAAAGVVTVDVAAVNDAPAVTIAPPVALEATEQVAFSLKNMIAIGDVDSGAGSIVVNLQVDYGLLNVVAGNSGVSVSGSGSGTVRLTGTLAQIQSLLGGNPTTSIDYLAGTDTPPGQTMLTVQINDAGNSGSGGALQASDSETIIILARNDAPSAIDHAIAVTEDTPGSLSAADFSFTDVEGHGLFSVTIVTLPGAGILYYDADGPSGAGLPVAVAAGTTFTAAELGGGGLSYVPGPNGNGTGYASFTYTVRDNGGTDHGGQDTDASPATIIFNVTPANDAPASTGLDGDAAAYDEGMPAGTVWLDVGRDALVTDIDSADFAGGSLTVAIIANKAAGEDQLVLDTASNGVTMVGNEIFVDAISVGTISADGVGLDRVITFNSGATAASVSRLIQNFSYFNTNQATPSTAQRLVEFRLADGDGATMFAHTTVAVAAVADTPVIANFNGDDVTFVEGSAAIRVDLGGDALVTDVDTMDFAGGYLQVLLEEAKPSEDVIGFATGAETGITLSNGTGTGSIVSIGGVAIGTIVSGSPTPNSFTVNFNADADAADVTALLRAITYLNTNTDHPSTLTRAIVVFVNDGDGGGQAGAVSTVHVTRINDAPTNTVPGGQTIDEDASLTLSTGNGNEISVADVDASTLTVTLSVAHGTLTIASTLGLTFSGGSDGTADASMTFSGTAAAINAALGSGLTYNPNANFNGSDAISVVTTDGGQTGTGPVGTDSDSIAVSLTAINDAPAGTSSTIVINEDNGRVLTAADFGYSDTADGNAFAGVVLTSLPAAGVLVYDSDGPGFLPGVFAHVGQFITAAELALGALTYYPASNAYGAASASFTFQVRDDGGTANGGQNTDQSPNTITFDINPVNDAPSGTSATITIGEDASRILTQADFGFSDPVEGNGFAGVVIATLPGSGNLLLNGVAVAAAGTFVSAAQIGAGQLVFAPGLNGNGAGYASFDFQVRDDGGTTNGGQDTDQSANSLTFNVTALNDAPALDLNGAGAGLNNNASYVENATPTLLAPAAVLGDVDSPNFDGGSVHAEVVASVQPSDFLQIVNQGTGAGQIGVSGSAVSYEGIQFGNLQQAGASALTIMLNSNATLAAVQALIRALSYFAPTEAPGGGSRSIVVSVADGDGGTVSRNVSLAVTPVNDAPSGTDKMVTGSEDDPYVFTAADFGFSDPGEGHDFFAVGITTLPLAGDILLNGVAVTAGDFIAVSAIEAGMLTFQPDPNGFGTAYASFTFQVQDSGGTANGGQDVDQTPNTITIAITPDNLAPVLDLDSGAAGADAALTYTENDPATPIAPNATLTDDSPDFAGGTIIARFAVNGAAGDQLSLRSGGGITVSPTDDTLTYGGVLIGSWGGGIGGADLAVQLNANASAAAVGAVLRAITYANLSDDPSAAARTIAVAVTDGDGGAASAQVIVNLIAVDDAAVARNDSFTIDEAATLSGSVFADHGAGADGDLDGPALSVAAVNGASAHVGQQILLASGALLTLNANGSFTYATNHAFDRTPAASSGASNTPADDRFTYTLAGGGTATVTLVLTGLDTDDTLFGTAGADVLAGGNGNDIYFLENSADQAVEAAGQGFDTIFSSAGYALAAGSEVEVLSAVDWTATSALNFSGNGGANIVYGNAGANSLDGGGGADVLIGFGGDDRYFVDSAADIVIEAAGRGYDSVFASASYALAAGSEVETLSAVDWLATNALGFTGNGLANVVYGNAGANSLDGGGGADVLIGFGGDDVYVVDAAADIAIEYAGQGYDTVYASADHALAEGSSIEVLSAIGWAATDALNLIGNSLGNNLYGNAGDNILNGGGGADLLTGFGGADTFAFTTALGGGNVDTVSDFVHGTDWIALDDAIFTAILGGTLGDTAFVIGAGAGDGNDRIIYNSATGALFYDADGNGDGAAIQFATLSPGLTLTASDFQVI